MPNNMTTRLKGLSVLAVISLSACATVDVSRIGAAPEPVAEVTEAQSGNVITRTVKRLYQVFTDRGWYEDTSREKVQSAANILLNGLQNSENEFMPFADTPVSSAALIDDIKTARYHVVQTTKAAEVYLDVASPDAGLDEDLKQLQKALRASEEVQANFSKSDVLNAQAKLELDGLMGEVDKLRVVTNNFGDAVRGRRLAAKAASAS